MLTRSAAAPIGFRRAPKGQTPEGPCTIQAQWRMTHFNKNLYPTRTCVHDNTGEAAYLLHLQVHVCMLLILGLAAKT